MNYIDSNNTLDYVDENNDNNKWSKLLLEVGIRALIFSTTLLLLVFFLKSPSLYHGDDAVWHVTYANDLYMGMNQGYFRLKPFRGVMGNLGIGTMLVYGPFSSYIVALLSFISKGSLSITTSFKIIVFIFTYLSGVFAYKLSYKITNNKALSSILGILYVVFPYKTMTLIKRCAIAEYIAGCMIPLLFIGLYGIVHDKDYKVSNYIYCSIALVLIILSHPFTGYVTSILGIFYLLFNIKKIIYKFKIDKREWISFVSAIVLTGMLISFYVFPLLEQTSQGIYRFNDEAAVWTTVEQVSSKAIYDSHTGFIRISDVYYKDGSTDPNYALIKVLVDSLSIIIFSFISMFLVNLGEKKNNKVLKYLSYFISFIPLIYVRTIPVIIGIILFGLLFFAMDNIKYDVSGEEKKLKDVFKDPELYWVILFFVILKLYTYVPNMWVYASTPIMRKCQFPFRLRMSSQFLLLYLLMLIISYAENKNNRRYLNYITILITVVCYSFGRTSNEHYANVKYNYEYFCDWYESPNSLTYSTNKAGVTNEYVPKVFYDIDYESKYSNSLYEEIREQIIYNDEIFLSALDENDSSKIKPIKMDHGIKEYKTPVFLEGEGTFEIKKLSMPNSSFESTVSSPNALVQIPQLYYKGYVANIKYGNGQEFKIKAQNIDGLVAFELPNGIYDVDIIFSGTGIYNISYIVSYLGFIGTVVLGVWGYCSRKKAIKNKNRPAYESDKPVIETDVNNDNKINLIEIKRPCNDKDINKQIIKPKTKVLIIKKKKTKDD